MSCTKALIALGKFAGDEDAAEGLAEYTNDLLDDALDGDTPKPHGSALELEGIGCTSIEDAVESISVSTEPTPFGAWVKRAMCLVPVQISRCAGSSLEPMHDGEPMTEASTDEDIIEVAGKLRLGPYECLLRAHTGPVKVVCALGKQSVGKSYQLNHFGGVFFDVAGCVFRLRLHNTVLLG